MEDFEMLKESKELGERILKLKEFTKSDAYFRLDSLDQFFLDEQYEGMSYYFSMLENRIEKRGLRTVEAEVKILD